MTVPPWMEMQLAVGGALRLAVGDRRGMGFFDTSLDGFWRSFRAAFVCYPFYLALVAFRVAVAQWEQSGVATILIVETISYVAAWAGFPLLVLPMAKWLHREDRFLAFMVVYNWSQLPQIVLAFIVGLDAASGLLPPAAAQFAELGATGAVLVYEWYIARVALSIDRAQAVVIVLLDLLLGTALGRVAAALY